MGLLHSAVWAGQWFATVLLLDCGADVDVRATDRRRTPLMRAADRTRSVRAEVMPAHLAMVRLLLSRGADVRAKDRMGHQAHQIAAMGTPVRALLSDVRAAGGWRSYVHRDRMRLLVLRALCEKGRATTRMGSSRGSSQWKRSRLRDHPSGRETPSSSTGLCLQANASETVRGPSEGRLDSLKMDKRATTPSAWSSRPSRRHRAVAVDNVDAVDACMQFEEA